VCAALFIPAIAGAQAFPTKPIRVIVPVGAGSTSDVITRVIGEPMSRALGQPWVVENRAGAGGMIGSEAVARAAPDGHTLLVFSSTFIVMPALYPKISFDIAKDIAAVGLVASTGNFLWINAERNVKNIAELITLAKATPGGLDYGSPAVGSTAHLNMEIFKRATGIPINQIPFKGPQQAMAETVGNRVPMTIAALGTTAAHFKAGRVVPIAVVDVRRSAALPNVPTFAEQGVSGVDLSAWFGMFATGGTPRATLERLNRELNAALKSPETAARLAQIGFDPVGGSIQDFEDLMKRERPVYTKLIADLGIKVD
jgi:tripartite-type tricarboxylate transporter receptor subunit TctC